MIPSEKLTEFYTDAPKPHRNLILGSLQLVFWLYFHPTAWRHHLYQTDPGLDPNFALTDLTPHQWRNRSLQRLLLVCFIILPLVASVLAGVISWLLGEPVQHIMLGMGVSLIVGLLAGPVGSLIVGTAVSAASVIAIGLGSGLVTAGLAQRIDLLLTQSQPDLLPEAVMFSIGFGLLIGLAGGLVGRVASSVVEREEVSFIRQSIAVAIGIGLACLMLVIAGSLIENNAPISIICGLVAATTVLAVGWWRGFKVGFAVGVLAVLTLSLAFAFDNDMIIRVIMFFAMVLPTFIVARSIAGPWSGVTASALGGGAGWLMRAGVDFNVNMSPMVLPHLSSVVAGLSFPIWGPILLYPFLLGWNYLLYRRDVHCKDRPLSYLRWHSAFWDEHQPLQMIGLDDHLLLIMDRHPVEGRAAMDYLAATRQRWAAQSAQIELDARGLADCSSVEAISQAHSRLGAGELSGPASALLRSFSRISQDVSVALEQASAYNQRLALSAVEDRLDGLLRELTRSSEPYAVRFRPIAARWRQTIADHVRRLTETVETRQEIDSPYVIGIPLTEQQEIFVGRTNISTRIEKLLLDRRRPPLLLFGQRRMGKTSLLNNLSRLLPSTIVPLFVDLQGPASQANDYTGFFYNIARGMINSAQRQRGLTLPPLPRKRLQVDPFTYFDEWLDEVETTLGDHTALVTLDEFEALESAIDRGRLDGPDLLSMLRHLIQHRPKFKILLTSSQTQDEFQRWASYLINVQVVHISYLTEREARQLIECPVNDFPLRYEPEASQRVLSLTRGHPFLVQLLCDEIVALKNEQDPAVRRLAQLEDVEAAVPEALDRGSFFFADIERNQVDDNGLAILCFISSYGEGAVIDRRCLAERFGCEQLDATLRLLIRRELIEPINGGYTFQVEMIRRWFVTQ
ncbi:MAG: ATP-binding protein [Anaerolineae bacterium]|nr:ATP-binding protein [Anaerolineae bacterium]MCB9106540.1 ATP-binding protein [Anaerolineales bacterium]